MPAPQIVHVEEVRLNTRVCTVSVLRVSGGLSAHWHCDCGEAAALPDTHLTVDNALQSAKRHLQNHFAVSHEVAVPAERRLE